MTGQVKRQIIRGATKNCAAKNPEKCRYHGKQFKEIKTIHAALDSMFERVGKDLKPNLVITPDKEARTLLMEKVQSRWEYAEDNLTSKERWAVNSYSDEYGSNHIRYVLLSPEKTFDFNGDSMENVHKRIALLDNVLEAHSADISDVPLWRGVKSFSQELEGIKVGQVINTPSFTSTSSDPEVAVAFSSKEAPILLRIKASKGFQMSGYHTSEMEVLLKRGSNFKVASITENVHLEKTNSRFGSDPVVRGITLVELEEI